MRPTPQSKRSELGKAGIACPVDKMYLPNKAYILFKGRSIAVAVRPYCNRVYSNNTDVLQNKIVPEDGREVICLGDVYAWVEAQHNYYRTGPAVIEIPGCDTDNISIQEIRTNQISQEIFYRSMYEVKPSVFVRQVNSGKIRVTVLEKYYAVHSAYLILRIQERNKKRYFAHMKMQYSWDTVRQDALF